MENMEKCITEMCARLLIKCLEGETNEVGLDVEWGSRGFKCNLKCVFEIVDFEEVE